MILGDTGVPASLLKNSTLGFLNAMVHLAPATPT